MQRLYYKTFLSPIGTLGSIVSDRYLYYLQPVERVVNSSYIQRLQRELGEISTKTTSLSLELKQQLDEYFKQQRDTFSIPMKPVGTDFQQEVWRSLTEVPYGQTTSYKEIAEKINHFKAYQAVGSAVGKNPILILQPCHRVLPTRGGIGEFSAGRERKAQLLQLESTI